MRNQPRPAFVEKLIDAMPADGGPISARGIWLAIGEISTPGYVRIVLRELTVAGRIIGTGPAMQRMYRRADALQVAS